VFWVIDLRGRRARLLGWLVGTAVLVGLLLRTPGDAVPAGGRLQPLRQAPTRQRLVALTFNVSWGVEVPRRVLAALEEGQTRATFFVSGPWAASHPEVVREMTARGHEIASLGHRYVDVTTLSRQELEEDLARAHRVLESLTGKAPRYFRPPDGRYNDLVMRVAREAGYTVVTWRTDSLDWKNPAPEQIARRVLARIAPGDIVLLNASDSARQTDRAIAPILSGLKERGYAAVTLSELLDAGAD